jgi:hypothetical protein
MEYAYTQAGQENSFTWDAMSKGFEIQLPLIARLRDIHLFNEKFPSVYETDKATANECSFFTLPFVDGYIWSKPSTIAGLRLKAIINGQEVSIEGGSPSISDAVKGNLHITWPIKTFEGSLTMDIDERQVKMKLVTKEPVMWFWDLTAADDAKLPFTAINPDRIDCQFEGMGYTISAKAGRFSKPDGAVVLRMTPVDNALILDLAGGQL